MRQDISNAARRPQLPLRFPKVSYGIHAFTQGLLLRTSKCIEDEVVVVGVGWGGVRGGPFALSISDPTKHIRLNTKHTNRIPGNDIFV